MCNFCTISGYGRGDNLAEKKSFVMYHDNRKQFEMLTDEQAGKIIKALMAYSENGTIPDFEDQTLQIMFSFMQAQIQRDAEKYEETCQKRSESGKKGGRPSKAKKANGFLAFSEKAKKADNDSDSVSDSVSDSENDSDTVCDVCSGENVKNTTHTTHTEKAEMSVSDVLELSGKLGYSWSEKEAQEFLAYNLDKKRTSGWGFAVRKWEENRESHKKRKPNNQRGKVGQLDMTAQEIEEMNAYLSVANRFREDGENG